MEGVILIVLIVLSVLVLVLIGCATVLLAKRPSTNLQDNLSSTLKSHFLEFQTNMQKFETLEA